MKKSHLLILLAIVFLAPRDAWGQWQEFLPKIRGYAGELELDAMYDHSSSESRNNVSENTDIAFRERLNLTMYGYAYHPRFISYRIRGAFGLEEYSSENERFSRSATGSSSEYDIRAVALPKHPYNLEVFASRREPLLAGTFASTKPVRYQYGSYLRYKKRPWQASLSYVLDTISQEYASFDTKTLRLTGYYFVRYFQVQGSYLHSDSQQPQGVEKTRDSFFIDSEASYKNMTLLSGLDLTQDEETEPQGAFTQLQRLTWREQLGVDLPWNLNAELSFQMNNDRNTSRPTPGATEIEAFAEAQTYGFALSHRLYRSLTTGLASNYTSSQSSGGETIQTNHRLYANYRKNIHRGKISTGVWTRYSTLDRSGAPTVLDEIHNDIGELDGFTLFNPDINRGTLMLRVRDDLGIVRDFEGQYIIGSTGDFLEITILSFAPTANLDPASTYTFLVSYSFLSGEYAIATRRNGLSIRFSLLDNLLQPYYSHSTTSYSLISGTYPGTLEDTTTDTLGLTVQKDPVSASLEYQRIESAINPETRWTARLNYYKYFTNYTKLFVDLEGERNTSRQFKNSGEERVEITEKVFSSDFRLQQRFPNRHIIFSLGGRYLWRTGITDTTIYSANSHLTWHVGKMDLNLGASYSDATTQLSESTLHSRNILVYTNLKRKLF